MPSTYPKRKPRLATIEKLIKATGIESLDETVAWLQEYQLPATNEEAERYLAFWHSVLTLHTLYATTYPREFARSKKSFIPERHAAYSEQEQEFFALVDRHLVPLSWWVFEALEREERLYGFSPISDGLDWWNDDPGEWRRGWQLLLWLIDEMDAQQILEGGRRAATAGDAPSVLDESLFQIPRAPGALDLKALEQRCRAITGPLRHLPQALKMLFHDTGTCELDNTSEMEVEIVEWSAENLALYAQDHREACEISAQAHSLVAWIEEDPSTHFMEVIHLWNLFIKAKPQQSDRL